MGTPITINWEMQGLLRQTFFENLHKKDVFETEIPESLRLIGDTVIGM
jgi:hypothetical protein